MGLEEEIREIEEEIAETPYNKSTEAHIGRLKAKLAEKKEELERKQSRNTATRPWRWSGSPASASRRF